MLHLCFIESQLTRTIGAMPAVELEAPQPLLPGTRTRSSHKPCSTPSSPYTLPHANLCEVGLLIFLHSSDTSLAVALVVIPVCSSSRCKANRVCLPPLIGCPPILLVLLWMSRSIYLFLGSVSFPMLQIGTASACLSTLWMSLPPTPRFFDCCEVHHVFIYLDSTMRPSGRKVGMVPPEAFLPVGFMLACNPICASA